MNPKIRLIVLNLPCSGYSQRCVIWDTIALLATVVLELSLYVRSHCLRTSHESPFNFPYNKADINFRMKLRLLVHNTCLEQCRSQVCNHVVYGHKIRRLKNQGVDVVLGDLLDKKFDFFFRLQYMLWVSYDAASVF